jgi:hypothetical protein
MTIKLWVTLNPRCFHVASRWWKRLIMVTTLPLITWRRRAAQVWVRFIHLTFERIYCLLVLMRGVRTWECGHRVLVIWSVSIRVRADCLSIQVGLRVFVLETLTCIANSGRRIGKNVGCLLLTKALLVVFVFLLDLSMLFYEHTVISLLALT